mgnify:FL=1|jgi:hypothetical protein
MAEIVGYQTTLRTSYQQSLQSKPAPPKEESTAANIPPKPSVEIVLSASEQNQNQSVYERPKNQNRVELTPTQQRAIDDLEFEKRSPDAVIDELI